MSVKTSEKYLFIVNPASGGRTDEGELDDIRRICLEKELAYSIVQTTGKNDRANLRETIREEAPGAVIVSGGDGTVNLVGSLLIGSGIPMGIIPRGSANGLAVSLGAISDLNACIPSFLRKNIIEMDVLKVNGEHLCFHQSSVGMNAKLIHYREKAGDKGMWGYLRHFLRTLAEVHTKKYEIMAGDKHFRQRADLITFANATKYGTGAVINPLGKVDDGQFEVCIFKPFPWYALFDITLKFFTGRLHESIYTRFIRTKQATVTSSRPCLLEVDGEVLGHFKEIKVEILPGAIRILV